LKAVLRLSERTNELDEASSNNRRSKNKTSLSTQQSVDDAINRLFENAKEAMIEIDLEQFTNEQFVACFARLFSKEDCLKKRKRRKSQNREEDCSTNKND
jgi:uncharacterized glyoxalase superfamily protein PhnB